jgi:CRP-like cAMP-binding protein
MDARKLKDKAQEAFGKGKFARAGEAYAQYCEADPSDLHARLRMGDAWSKAGQKEKAIGAYSWAAEGFAKEGFLPRAIAASKLILELDPAHKGVQKMLADLYARKNTPVKRPQTGSFQAPSAAATQPSRGLSLEPEAKPAAAAARPAPKAPEPPSPMNRADAIELPPDDPLPQKHETAVDKKQRLGFELRDDGISLPEASPPGPLARAPGAKGIAIELDVGPDDGGIELDVGTGGGAEIEIAVIDSTPSAPPAPPRAPALEPLDPLPSAPPLQGVPLDGPLDAPLEQPILLDTPKRPAPPPPLAGPKGGAYELDTGEDESLESYAAQLKSAPPSAPEPPPAIDTLPAPQASAPLDLVVEVEAPEPAVRAQDPFFDPEAVNTVAPQADLPPPSAVVPSIAPAVVPVKPLPSAEPPRPSPSLPPGLRKKAPETEAPAAAAEASGDARIWLPPGFAPPAVAPLTVPQAPKAASAPTEARSAATDLEKSLEVFSRFDVDAPAPAPAPAQVAAPVAAPALPGFTELELEGDSLLHAVEAAATQGAAARGEAAPVEEALDAPEPDAAAPGALPKIPLFSDLPEDAFIALFESCPLRRKEPGELIVEQGSHGDALYVICAGAVKVFKLDASGRRIDLAKIDEGAFFGEMALLSDRPRSASVEAASEDTQLLEISAAVLAGLSKQYPTVAAALKKFCRQRMLANLMGSAPLFQPFSKSDRRDLVQKFRSREAKKGEQVIREGQRSDGMYVILSGEVDVTVGAARVASLKEGDVFGEMSLLTKAPAAATVTTARRTSLLRLPREDFDTLILSHPQILMLVSELTDERKRQNAKLGGPAGGAAPMV